MKNINQKKIFWAILVIHSLLSSVVSFGQSGQAESQRQKLRQLIDQEKKTLLMANNRGAELEHRLLELGSEELRLIRQEENERFIKEGAKESARNQYFQGSTQLERELYKKSQEHLEHFPQYSRKGEVYYTMALNNHEFGDGKLAESLYLRALEQSSAESTNAYNVRVSLAEFYFNDKKYQQSISHYQVVVQNYTDKWRSKHLYNMAWSFLKAMDYPHALEKLKDGLVQSKKPGMVDNSVQLLESVPLFFVLESKVPEAIVTIKKYAPRPIGLLLKLATTAGEKMGETQALLALKEARTLAAASAERDDNFQVLDWELDFHQLQKRSTDFLKGLQTFVAFHKKQALPKDVADTVVNKTKFFVGDLQETLAKDVRDDASVFNKEKLQVIIDTFEALAVLAPKEEGDWRFYQGESLFAIRNFEQAFKAYAMGMKAAIEKRVSTEVAPKIFASAFATLEEKSYPEAQKQVSLRLSYEAYLKIWPKTEQASSIYQKLAALYLHQKTTADVERVLDLYANAYPAEKETQRGQLLALMDIYIERKEAVTISQWLEKMKAGIFQVDGQKVKDIEVILGQILFGEYEKMADRDQAIKGLKELFSSEVYPDSIKEKSSFNLAVEYNKRADADRIVDWAQKSLPITPVEALHVKTGAYLGMLLSLNDWGEWKQAQELSSALNARAQDFKEQSQKETLFKLFGLALIQNRDFEKYPELFKMADQNNIAAPIIETLSTQLASSWAMKNDDWSQEKELLARIPTKSLEALAERSLVDQWVAEQNLDKNVLSLASSEIQSGFAGLQEVQKAMEKTSLEFKYEGELFEVEQFKASLATLMEALKTRVAQAEALGSASNPLFVVAGQALLIETYQQFTQALESKIFVFPSEDLKVALETEKQKMKTEITSRTQELVGARAQLLARQDLAIPMEKRPKIKMEMGKCELNQERKAQMYGQNKKDYFSRQAICLALKGKWEGAEAAIARLKEEGGQITEANLKLAKGLAAMSLGDATQGIQVLSQWKKEIAKTPSSDSDINDQIELVNALMRSYGKDNAQNPTRSLSWNQ